MAWIKIFPFAVTALLLFTPVVAQKAAADKLPSIYAQSGQYVPTQPSTGATADAAAARTAAAFAQKIKDNTTFHDLIGAKIVQGPIAWADRALQEQGIERDSEFYGDKLQPYLDRAHAAGLDSQTALLTRATSPAHAELLMSFMQQNKMAQDDSAQFGLLGNVAASVLDPSVFALAGFLVAALLLCWRRMARRRAFVGARGLLETPQDL